MPTMVLSVGQCGYDDSRIGALVRGELGAHLDRARSAVEALRKITEGNYALVLINRIFDSDGDSGVDFIAELKSKGVNVPVMLISDYADAQQAAIANGAAPGFGKSALMRPETADVLKAAITKATI